MKKKERVKKVDHCRIKSISLCNVRQHDSQIMLTLTWYFGLFAVAKKNAVREIFMLTCW